MKLRVDIDPRMANQTVLLSDSTMAELSGVRIPQLIPGQMVVQWTLIVQDHEHEGFVHAGDLKDGQIVNSLNGNDQYTIHFKN